MAGNAVSAPVGGPKFGSLKGNAPMIDFRIPTPQSRQRSASI